jgi:DNA-binding transcriptional regulator YdaS (Cro superfamily)
MNSTSTSPHRTGLEQILWLQGRKYVWVARSLGVNHGTVSRWASGEVPLPQSRALQLSQLLGVSPDEIASVRTER